LQFIYYSDRTVSQCMMALNERIHAKNGKLDGWTEKSGNFALEFTSSVMRRFSRTTRLQAKAERENNITIIKGHVSEGIDPQRRAILYGLLVLAGVFIILQGSVLPGLIAVLAPILLNIPLEGDHNNSQVLLSEIQRTLKARGTPPTAPTRKTSEPRKTTVARKSAVTRKATTARKTASQHVKAHR
jgi:hypothetical protein